MTPVVSAVGGGRVAVLLPASVAIEIAAAVRAWAQGRAIGDLTLRQLADALDYAAMHPPAENP